MHFIFIETGKLFANAQGCNEGARRAQFPGWKIIAEGAKKSRQCHKYFLQ